MTKVRIGILSFAHYHANFWSEVFRDSPDVDFAGVWDDDPQRGAECAARYGARFVPSLDALLEAVDAVAVCSETSAHRPLIERAAARGKHILCEKPIATTREDARAIAAARESFPIWQARVTATTTPSRLSTVCSDLQFSPDSSARHGQDS